MTHTLGCDTNHWEGRVDSVAMKASGIKFNIPKMTDFVANTTTGFQDSEFQNTYQGHKEQSLPIGGYHWLQPGVDPTVQARYYLNWYFSYDLDIQPVLDFEDPKFTSPTDYLWRAQVWLNVVEKETGKIPIIYTGSGFMGNFKSEKVGWMVRYPLWLAQYTLLQAPPRVPYPWDNWTLWQFTASGDGRKYGITGKAIDLDYFNGSLDDLYQFLGGKWAVKPTLYKRVMRYLSGDRLKQVR